MKQPRRRQVMPTTTYGAILGKTIAAHRSEGRIDQAQLAVAVGVNQSTWSRIERGISALTIEQLRAAAVALKVSPVLLVDEAERGVAQANSRGIRLVAPRDPKNIGDGVVLIDAAALKALIRAARSSTTGSRLSPTESRTLVPARDSSSPVAHHRRRKGLSQAAG